jgi:cyclophilin family peptidyl-prolyl cis-trans isomerase
MVFAAPTLGPVADQTLLLGAPLHVPLDGFDSDMHALSYSVSSDNADVIAELRLGNRSMRIHVEYVGDGTPADPSFSGDLVFELFEDLAPQTTSHIIQLIQDGFYDGVTFHRVAEDQTGHFVIQGGDPTGTGGGGSNLGEFDDEFHVALQHTSVGILSMAKAGDDTNDSQFFITGYDTRFLDFNHSVFGRLVEGEDIRQKIADVPVDVNDKPIRPVTMTSVTLFTDTQNKVLTLRTGAGATASETATITVDVSDGQGGTVQQTFEVTTATDPHDAAPFLPPIPIIQTTANTPVQVTIPWIDADGGEVPIFSIVPSSNPNLGLAIDSATGVLTVTPASGLTGVHSVIVRVRNASSDFDQQAVPILIAPAAPSAPDLVTASDTGSSTSDNITRLDNSTGANQLQFVVNNVIAGALVQLTVGGVSIGQGTVPAGATSITITTNGTLDLTDGVHNVIAVQVLVGQQVNVGNFVDTVDLVSDPSQAFSFTVDTTAPSITSTPPTTGDVGVPLSYNVESDEESAAGFVYELVERPNGATINAATGQITWVPVLSQMGNQTFRVRGTDAAGNLSADHVFTVAVANTQTGIAPAIDPIGDQTTSEGTAFSIDANATDGNLPNDLLTFSLVSPPTGMTIDPSTGVISWTPGESFGGQTLTITVRVTDAFELTDDETFELFVNEVNQAPTISTIGNKSATVGQQLTFTVSATDADLPAQTLSYSLAAGAPAGAAINSSGVFTWTPTAAQLPGPHSITVRVSDGTATTDQTISVTLTNGAVQVVNGELVIEGTSGNDAVTIRGTSTPGRYEVTGSLGTTTVNGVTGELRLELGDGNDTVTLSGAFVAGDVLFDMGGGNDSVQFGDQAAVSSTGDFTVLLGAGDDELRMQRAYVVGDLVIETGAGRDRLDLTGVSNATQFWAGSSSRGSMTIRTGDGDDEIDISLAFIVGATEVDAGAGNDAVRLTSSAISGKTSLRGGDGHDSLTADGGYFLSSIVLDGGLGADSMRLMNSIAMGSASLAGGSGHDVGELANFSVPHLNVSQGGGQDAVTMRGSALHSFFADLGEDNDALTLESNSIFGAASVSGGAGASDLLADRGNLFGAGLLQQLFESLG